MSVKHITAYHSNITVFKIYMYMKFIHTLDNFIVKLSKLIREINFKIFQNKTLKTLTLRQKFIRGTILILVLIE